jgi:hypothetical protein
MYADYFPINKCLNTLFVYLHYNTYCILVHTVQMCGQVSADLLALINCVAIAEQLPLALGGAVEGINRKRTTFFAVVLFSSTPLNQEGW